MAREGWFDSKEEAKAEKAKRNGLGLDWLCPLAGLLPCRKECVCYQEAYVYPRSESAPSYTVYGPGCTATALVGE